MKAFRLVVWSVTWIMMGIGWIMLIATAAEDNAISLGAVSVMVTGGGVVTLGGAYSIDRIIAIVEEKKSRG